MSQKQAEKLKSREMKEGWMKSDEGWMKSDEGWMKNNEEWRRFDEGMKDDNFKLLRSFDYGQTKKVADIGECMVPFATENHFIWTNLSLY